MPYFDLPLDKLQSYWPDGTEQDDFDAFWDRTLTEARTFPLSATFTPVDTGLRLVESYDVTFAGFRGQTVKGWLTLPARRDGGKLPCVVEYIGYSRGRGLPIEHLMWANAGYAHLLMDTRGQGSNQFKGATADQPGSPHPHIPGFLTSGINDPDSYYYRRVFTDAVRAIEAARSHPAVDAGRIALTGKSQGGGISLAAAALVQDNVQAIMPDVPFLCHYRRAVEIIGGVYGEITQYLSIYRDKADNVWRTLSYFDGINFAPRITIPAYFSVGLMDGVCPPSTVFAAFNRVGSAKKSIEVYPYNEHEGGGAAHQAKQITFLKELWG